MVLSLFSLLKHFTFVFIFWYCSLIPFFTAYVVTFSPSIGIMSSPLSLHFFLLLCVVISLCYAPSLSSPY